MRRRTAVQTLLRVTELQEAVARGKAGQALAAARAAQADHALELSRLQGAGLSGGSRQALEASTQVRLFRAGTVADAATASSTAAATQDVAVQGWRDARRRHRLFEELADRQRAEGVAQQEKTAQRLSDDLAGLRREQR